MPPHDSSLPASPTLMAHRAVSTARVRDTRQYLAQSAKQNLISSVSRTEIAEVFVDELRTIDEISKMKARTRMALALAGATICLGLVIAAMG